MALVKYVFETFHSKPQMSTSCWKNQGITKVSRIQPVEIMTDEYLHQLSRKKLLIFPCRPNWWAPQPTNRHFQATSVDKNNFHLDVVANKCQILNPIFSVSWQRKTSPTGYYYIILIIDSCVAKESIKMASNMQNNHIFDSHCVRGILWAHSKCDSIRSLWGTIISQEEMRHHEVN